MESGVINIYKEKGFTSHDVVNVVRKILKTKKVGHTGTLDPDAEGVLPICIGAATKIAEYLQADDKSYEVTIKFGIVTDTGDMTGKIIKQSVVTVLEGDIKKGIMSFEKSYKQLPPMYSAIKINGQKLYDLARAGKEVEREKRDVTISNIQIKGVYGDEAVFSCHVSKGTYIRSLCEDIGDYLGCGATMKSLIRLSSGDFKLEGAVTLKSLQMIAEDNKTETVLIPISKVLSYKKYVVKSNANKFLYNGNLLYRWAFSQDIEAVELSERILVYDEHNVLIGIYECIKKESEILYKPVKMLFDGGMKAAMK